MLERGPAAGGDRRGALRARALPRLPPGRGPAHPHRRRAAHQQLPAVAPGLCGALFHSAVVAGFLGVRSRGGARVLCHPRTALRAAPLGCQRGPVNETLRKRVLTAVVAAAALLGVLLWMPPWATVVVLTALLLAGAWEWSAFLRLSTAARRLVYVALVAVLLPLAWRISADPENRGLILMAAVLWWVTALLWIAFAPRRVTAFAAGVAGVLALVPSWLALVWLRLAPPHGEWVLFAFVLVWVADIGAFFFGRRYGRIRLAPVVSPGKTWEGVLGGVGLSSLVAIGGSLWFHVPLAVFLPLCLATVAFSVVGDLTESLLKRFAGMKDSGTVFPGHGGVMDRIDSLTGAAPVLLLGLTLLKVVP